jgi:hypothetical protein
MEIDNGEIHKMNASQQQVVEFLEKEIKTYKALALFLAKGVITRQQQPADMDNLALPAYYQERMREATALVNGLRNRS